MKVEIHSHTAVFSPCSVIPPDQLVGMAEASGYDVLFITDHNRVWSKRALAGLRELTERVLVLPGIEISLPDRHDILVLGAQEAIYERLRSPSDVMAQACADGFLTVIAHPFRYHDMLPDYCASADALEGKTCNHSVAAHLEWASRYAAERRLAEVYSSDAHGLNFMNKFWIETFEDFETPQEFRRIVLSGRYRNCEREFEMPLPPPVKVARMSDLSAEDHAALVVAGGVATGL